MKTDISLPAILGKGYGSFWRDRKRFRVLKGGKASKKSTTTALNLIYRLMKYPESNLLVVRRVMNTHRDSTFAQLKWAQEKLGVSHLWQNNVSPMEMTYIPTGQKILFRGFDDVLKLASTTVSKGYLNFVWIEEAFEIENEADFDKLCLSVPRGEVPPPLFKQTTLTFNPWSESHWLKRRFFDTTHEDVSTYSTNYLQNEFLSDDDRRLFEEMKRTNYRRYMVAGLGEWGIAEGLIYENWEVKRFDVRELLDDFNFKCFFGLDFGYTNDPTAFIAFALNPKLKELYIYDEIYEKRLLNSDIAKKIIAKGYAKERIRADAAEPKSIDDLRRLGLSRICPSMKGRDSIINGITSLQEYKIYVLPSCENAIKELGSYRWKTDKTENGINVPEDCDNHLMDAMRYAFYDVRHFYPEDPSAKQRSFDKNSISAADFTGNWS